MLSNLPVSRSNPLRSKDLIYIITVQGPGIQNLNATGLNQGTTASYLINGKTVAFQ
jgi:hypothetical protein